MATADTIAALATFDGRGAGTDAERRTAQWLAQRLRQTGRTVAVETFWCRPNSALAHAWHVALGLAGSLIAVGSPWLGGGLVLLAALSLIADELAGVSLGRRLTPERASQNVVAQPPAATATPPPGPPQRLILTANYDAGRAGLVYRRPLRPPATRLARMTGRRGPGWLGWLAIAFAWLIVVAILRTGGARGTAIGAAQLVPTVGLVIALALLLELASADDAPAAGDNGSGVAAVLALAAALDVAPPAHATITVVLTGAGDPSAVGLRRHLRRHRRELARPTTIVLGVAACSAGEPRWWISDGPFVPRRYLARLRELAARVAREQPHLHARSHRGRATGPAFRARARRLPAITIGALDAKGTVPRSHTNADTPDTIDQRSVDATIQFGLMLVDAIDAHLRVYPGPQPQRQRNRAEAATPA